MNVAYARVQSAQPADSRDPAVRTTGGHTRRSAVDRMRSFVPKVSRQPMCPGARQPAQESAPAPASRVFALLRGLNPDSLEAEQKLVRQERAQILARAAE